MAKVAKLQKNNKSSKYVLKSGREIQLKTLTLDIRDELMDEVEYTTDKLGKITGVSAMQKTITKWLKGLLKGDVSDEDLLEWSMDDRIESFSIMQKMLFLGEGKPST